MSGKSGKISHFWNELRRRRVIHVIVVYATVSFAIIELVNNVYESLQLPAWTPTLVLLILIIGFPIAIIFSWIYDITSKGIVKTSSTTETVSNEDTAEKDSIVVLPFENMSPEPEQEYFCDGITEEIINALTHVKSMKVIARTSAFAFKGKYEDIRKIGKELNVARVLEGSVRKSDKRLRITAQLINVSDGIHLWSETYDCEMKDIFEIQDEISLAIVDKLKVDLIEDEKKLIQKIPTENLEAYAHYLKGRHYWYNNRNWEGLQKAMQCFQQAIDADPGYALAITGLADTYIVLMDWGYLNPLEVMPKIRELLKRSLSLDSSHAETYMSHVYPEAFFDLDYEAAEVVTARALQLNRNSSVVHHFYALYQMTLGEFESAIQHNSRARELDPLSAIFNFAFGLILYTSGQFEKAIEQYRKTLQMEKSFVLIYLWGMFPLLQLDRIEEAAESYKRYLHSNPETEEMGDVPGMALRKGGKEGFLQWIIDEGLSGDKGVYNHPYWKAVLYANMGKSEEALDQLEQVMALKSPRMSYIWVDPAFMHLRTHPRFTGMIQRPKLARS
jgi:TolB-like protein/Tfp pilus assembly protein PilF